ncbi:MAG TPA: hypothetical protein VK915_04570 [Gaiellaceae bacterium]|nr:hypothetical protein [Gaiellaceae bacterium]
MSVVEATGELLSDRRDVWRLLAEPYHLPDWWPAYTGVEPDRRGLAENARWQIVRSTSPGLLRRPEGQGLIVLTRVLEGWELRWLDVKQGIEAAIVLDNAGTGKTKATVSVSGPWHRLVLEGARNLPERALKRLQDLCQTAASV